MRQDRRNPARWKEYHGWVGWNPEHDEGPRVNHGADNEYGWYGAHPGPHVDDALGKHFNATKSDDEIDFEKFGRTAAAVTGGPPEITGAHPMMFWPQTNEVRVGWKHQYHDELGRGGNRAIVRPGKIEWLYDQPPDNHAEVSKALTHHYGQPFESNGYEYDFERFAGMTLNQEKKAWPGPVGEPIHQFDNGYHIVRHNDVAGVVQVGQHMRNCWQNGNPIDLEQGPYAEDPYARAPVSFMSLHDEHGLPRAAFYLRNNPRSFEPLKILQALGPRNRKLPEEHKALIRDWADKNGYAYEGSLGEAPEAVRGVIGEPRAAAIDWEAVGERPYVPAIDDDPKATATVHLPEQFSETASQPYNQVSRVPFWVLNHPTKDHDYHVLMGHPSMEHMGIHEVHDRGFDQYPTAASGGIMPAGSGKIGGPHYDKDTVEFYLNHQRSVHPDEYAAEQHYWDWEDFRQEPKAFRQEDMERLIDTDWQLDLERKRDNAMYKAVEQAIKDHPVLSQHYKDFNPMVRAEDPIDFEKFGATLPGMRLVAFEHIADEIPWAPEPDEDEADWTLEDPDWREELADHKQLEPWRPGDNGKGILHHDDSITTWTNPKIHHQDVERFLHPHGKRTKAFIDMIHPDGTALFEGDEAGAEVLKANKMRPVNMENYDFDFDVFGTPEHESIMKEFAL